MANGTQCLSEGKRLFTSCSLASGFQDCCLLAVAERIDEQCLFAGNLGVQQLNWASECCGDGISTAQCHGYDCRWFTPSLCCPGASGLVFPLFGESEAIWPQELKIILYIAGLIYLFMAVAAAADMFMQGVEIITSTQIKVAVMVDGHKKMVVVQKWNDTVANLTLMALGSSAPEILLSIIELLANDMFAGSLGPSTIVGSASFNLFVISAICISALPDGEVRRINDTNVFLVTASFSIFAYLWIVFILEVTSPDRIEIWEGGVTFGYSIVLIITAYAADIGKLNFFRRSRNYIAPEADKRGSCGDRQAALEETNNANVPALEEPPIPRRTRAAYRSQAIGKILGAGVRAKSLRPPSHAASVTSSNADSGRIHVSFESAFYSCIEGDKIVHLEIKRTGPDDLIEVPYKTVCGTAKDDVDFVPVDTVAIVEAGEMQKRISIVIIDDDICDDDKQFFVQLGTPRAPSGAMCKVGIYAEAKVVIIDDDEPGVLSFELQTKCVRGTPQVSVHVKREHGCSAAVSCSFHTYPQTATPDKDYITTRGDLQFSKGDVRKVINIVLPEVTERRKQLTFKVVLSSPKGGVTFADSGGHVTSAIETIVILEAFDSATSQELTACCAEDADANVDVSVFEAFAEQFREAIYTNGSLEDSRQAAMHERVLHYSCLPFNLLLALTPPSRFCGGWLRFCVSMLFIAIFTALINEMAQLVGCALGVPDAITAITFVALGTSIPDTFASHMAALSDPYADNCIGNITGSNSVNVFLGLGISWTMGAIFWEFNTDPRRHDSWVSRYRGKVRDEVLISGGFAVRAGTLSTNVVAFSIFAVLTLIHLVWRRLRIGGELGGSKKHQHLSSALLLFFWLAYVISATITSIDDINKIKGVA